MIQEELEQAQSQIITLADQLKYNLTDQQQIITIDELVELSCNVISYAITLKNNLAESNEEMSIEILSL